MTTRKLYGTVMLVDSETGDLLYGRIALMSDFCGRSEMLFTADMELWDEARHFPMHGLPHLEALMSTICEQATIANVHSAAQRPLAAP